MDDLEWKTLLKWMIGGPPIFGKETSLSHLWKRKIIFTRALGLGFLLVPRRVCQKVSMVIFIVPLYCLICVLNIRGKDLSLQDAINGFIHG